MRIIDPSAEGLIRVDSDQNQVHPTKPEGEIWFRVPLSHLGVLTEVIDEAEMDAYGQKNRIDKDLKCGKITEEQADLIVESCWKLTYLARHLRNLRANPEDIAKYSQQID